MSVLNTKKKPCILNHTGISKGLDEILLPAQIFERSYGLMPFKIMEVRESAIKEKILRSSLFEEGTDNTHLLIIAVRLAITHEDINTYIEGLLNNKKITGHSLVSYRKHIEGLLDKQGGVKWISRQAEMAVDILKSSANDAGAYFSLVDNFDKQLSDKNFGLNKIGFVSYVAVLLRLSTSKSIWSEQLELSN